RARPGDRRNQRRADRPAVWSRRRRGAVYRISACLGMEGHAAPPRGIGRHRRCGRIRRAATCAAPGYRSSVVVPREPTRPGRSRSGSRAGLICRLDPFNKERDMKGCLKILAPVALMLPGMLMAQETLKIGALVTLSGAGAAWGQALLYGAELAADDVNAQGGLEVGGKKYKIEVIPYDDKYEAAEAVTAANRLISDDKVRYLIGPMGSAPALAVQPLTEREKVIIMTLGFTNKALSPNKPYSFRPNLTTEETSYPIIKWLVERFDLKKIGGLFPNDESGQQISGDLAKAYEKAGAELSSKEFFERQRVDMVPLLTRMLNAGIDAIELDGNSPATAGMIVRQARELGFKGPIVRNGGPATPEIVAVAGKAATEGMMVTSLQDPANQEVAQYAQRYSDK